MTANQLQRLQTEIRRCTRCVEAGFIASANPILRGNAAARIMVIGQAPGPTAIERPVPYSGASGRTLQAWLVGAGFPPEALHDPDRFYLTSLTKCFPGRAKGGAGDRPPGRAEIELCSGHLAAELSLVKPELILALGRLSISTMVPSVRRLPLASIVGGHWEAELAATGGAAVLPLPHPSGVSRWHNSKENQERLAKALHWLSIQRERRCW